MSTKFSGCDEMGIPMPSNRGYHKLAAIMGSDPCLSIYRRFTKLNAKRILHLQAELMILEEELDAIIEEDRSCGDPTRENLDNCWASLRDSSTDRKLNLQWERMDQIKGKLKEYNEALLQQSQLQELHEPHKLDIQFLREWLDRPLGGDFFMQGVEADVFKYEKDLVCLKPKEDGEKNSFAVWLSEKIIPWFHLRIGHRVLKPLPDIDDVTKIWKYDGKIFSFIANAICAVLTSLLPVSLIFILYFVKNKSRRLIVIVASTVFFSLTLLCIGKARRSDIFIAATALATVQVVFVGDADSHD